MEPSVFIGTSAAMIAVGLAFILILTGRKKRPGTPMEWFGVGVSSLLVLFASVLLVLGFTMGDKARSPFYIQEESIGEAAPDFTFRKLHSNERTNLSDYKGNVVLVNFWATWCPPCLDEMPDLNRLYEEYRDEGLVVLTISDEQSEILTTFDDNVVPLDTETGYLEDVRALPSPYIRMLDGRPESYVIDRDGVIREFILGARNYNYFRQSISPYL